MTAPVKWGVLGASNFALSTMARAIHEAEGAQLVALATSSQAKAAPFQAFCPDLEVFTDYDAMLASDLIEAVYIPLPNHLHVEWAKKAMAAGKHVLCEKPIALQADEIDDLITMRDVTGLFCSEAYMIVHHPQWQRVKALLAAGEIGELAHVETSFSFNNQDFDNIRNRADVGGGSLRDIGVYTLGSTRFATGAEPKAITHTHIDYQNGIDATARVAIDFGTFTFSGMTSMRMANYQHIRFHGDQGVISLRTPYNASAAAATEVEIRDARGNWRVENFTPVRQYVHQVQNVTAAIRDGADYPWTLEDARGTQRVMDAIFAFDQGASSPTHL